MTESPHKTDLEGTEVPEPAGPELPEAPPPRASAVERLFREHNQALLRFLMAKLGSPQEAKDVAQEAYVRLLKLDTPGAPSFPRALLFKTASNLAIDRLRSRQAEMRRLEMDFFEDPPLEPDPAHRAATTEELAIIQHSLERLPPKCRQAFLLNRFDGLSCAEIGQRMGIPERTVRHYIVEALIYCKSYLERRQR